jgi:hypothetical protein
MHEILHNGTKGLDAPNNHYGNQIVKMDSRICNYFILFLLYFKQWTSATLT